MGTKLTIEQMQALAKKKGGKFLSKSYEGSMAKHLWKCSRGHKWATTPQSVKNAGTWCPECARANSGATQRLTIEEMHKIAKSRRGKCLSKKYVNSKSKLKWECSRGHQWDTAPINIRQGTWCPKCRGK